MLLNPPREPVSPALPAPGVTPEALASHQQALDWFKVEQEVLSASVALAARTGFDTGAWQLAWAVDDYLRKTTSAMPSTTLGNLTEAASGSSALRQR